MRKPPPKRKKGQAQGPRTINGQLLGVREAASFLGVTEKTLRAKIDRRLIPCRRWGSRWVFRKSELDAWWETLQGCSLEEAMENEARRE